MKLQWHWGTRLALVYVTFALGTLTMVGISVSQKTDLVTPDYYAQALATDERMAATHRARQLDPAFEVHHDAVGHTLTLRWPHRPDAGGTMTLYRPSDASADRTMAITVDDSNAQLVTFDDLAPGVWRLQVSWHHAGHRYFAERLLTR